MFKTHFIRALIFAVLGALIGFIYAKLQPSVYEATAEMLLGESAIASGQTNLDSQVMRILETGVAKDAQTELQLLRSQTVFFGAFRNACQTMGKADLVPNWLEYYLKYEVISIEQRAGALEQGSVAQLQVQAYSREFAEEIANQITAVYNDLRVTNARNSAANAKHYVSAQVDSSKKTLDKMNERYREYTTANNIVDAQISTTQLENLRANTLNNLNLLKQQYAGAQSRVSEISSSLSGMKDTIRTSSGEQKNDELRVLESQLAQLRIDRDQLLTRYFPDHPRVKERVAAIKEAETKIAQIKKQSQLEDASNSYGPNPVKNQLESQLALEKATRDGLGQQVARAEESLREVESKLNQMPANDAELRDRRRDLELADLNYRRVKSMLDELENRTQTGIRTAVVLSEAQAYRDPVLPDVSKLIFIGTIAGISLGLIFSFSLESLRLRVHNSQQLTELTGLPVVATVPRLGKGTGKTVAALAQPSATPGESFRHMAYTMLAKTEHIGPKTILFTAVGTAPGRPSSSTQFAMAMAATGKRVLLVDADVHRGLISKAFGAEGRSGLNEIFERSTLPAEGTELIVPTPHENLMLLPAGTEVHRSIADRSTAQIEAFMKYVAAVADLCVIDTAPCDVYSDASRLASYVDETCIVISAATTHYNQIPIGFDILTRAGAKNVSLVLTDASPQDEPFSDAKKYRSA